MTIIHVVLHSLGSQLLLRCQSVRRQPHQASRHQTPWNLCYSSSRPSLKSPITGTLKETVQKGQQLIWRGRESPNDRRFQVTNISVAFLRNEPGGQVKMTFAGDISSLGYRPVDEAKLNIIVRTKGDASI